MRSRAARFGPGIALVAWVYLSVIAALWGWIAVTWIVCGWKPVVIESNSMSPGLQAGDVVMIGPAGDKRLGRGAVVSFRDDTGDSVVHRIDTVEPDGAYSTKGDANNAVDPTPVSRDAVNGVARLVVPAVGRPFVWRADGSPVLFVWSAVTVAAVGTIVAARKVREDAADA